MPYKSSLKRAKQELKQMIFINEISSLKENLKKKSWKFLNGE
jgi:hypothetical protein